MSMPLSVSLWIFRTIHLTSPSTSHHRIPFPRASELSISPKYIACSSRAVGFSSGLCAKTATETPSHSSSFTRVQKKTRISCRKWVWLSGFFPGRILLKRIRRHHRRVRLFLKLFISKKKLIIHNLPGDRIKGISG